jgi:RHS repeat-associated protein
MYITPSVSDTGYVALSVTVSPNYLSADFTATNSSNQDMGACAASCFAATYGQSTVPYYSLDQPRSVTLAYSGDRVSPHPYVYADVAIGSGAPANLVSYEMKATRNGAPAAIQFTNGDTILRFAAPAAGQTQSVRLGGQIDASSEVTASGALTLTVTAVYNDGTRQVQTLTSNLLVVNAQGSAVARGWSVAGLQRIDKQSGGTALLLTDGTGSATYFGSCGTGCFASPQGDYSVVTKSAANYVRAYPDSTKATFDTVTGRMATVADRFGNMTSFEYDGSGRLIKIYDPYRTYNGGASRSYIALTYGTYGISQIQEPGADGSPTGGRITSFTVGSDSTLRVFKDPDGDSTRFGYDGLRRLSTIINRRGDTTSYVYDSLSGKLAWVDLPSVTLYNGTARPRVRYSAWQALGVPTASTSGTPMTPVLTNSVQGSTTDALGRAVSFTTDRWGQPLSITDPVGRTTTITRNGAFFPSSIRYPEGGTDNFTFAGALLTSQTAAGQTAVNIHYGAYAQPDTISGTGRPKINASLGPGGRVDWVRLAGQDSLRISYTYDSRGRVLSQTDSLGHTTSFHYDTVSGNLDSTLAPGNRFTKSTFDGHGRLKTQQSNNEPQRVVTYDTLNRVLQVNDGVNPSPTIYGYDKLFLVRVKDAKGQVYRIDKNALGWTTRRYDPADTLNRYDSYVYDSTGRLHSWTNRRGQQINYTYDVLDRLISKSGTNTSTDSLAYSTDGKIAVMWNAVERDSVFRDSTGWVKSVVTRVSGQRFQIDYRPNNIQQIDTVLVSGGGITFAVRHYGWNRTIGTLDTISVNGTLTRFVRNKDLLPTQTIWPSLTRTEAWTAIHRPSQSTFSVPSVDSLLSRRYSYDSRFEMQDYIKPEGANWRSRQRTYDGLRRLSGLGDDLYAPASCGSDPASGYLCPIATQGTITFDAVGNRADAPDTLYTTGNRMTRFNGYTYAYDLDGNDTNRVNIATGDRKSYEWSADGLLNRVLVNGVEKVRFEYNVGGQLVRRWTNGTLDRTYLWDGGQLLAELNASANQRLSEYAYSPGADLPFAIMTGATSITATRYHLIDEVGNVIGVMNGASVDEQISYDDWGVATTIGNTDNQLLFKGLLWQPDAGLYYMRARWYDPGPGRFISEDPIGLAGGINQYAFSASDPINGSDPSGTSWLSSGWKWLNKRTGGLAPAVLGFGLTVAAGAGPLGFLKALGGAAAAFGAASVGSFGAAVVETVATGSPSSFNRIFRRNLNVAGLTLGAFAVGGELFGGGIKSLGATGMVQGSVATNNSTFGICCGLTLGPASIITSNADYAANALHELGHTVQFIALSALGRGKGHQWWPYLALGGLGYLGQDAAASGDLISVGRWWEYLATTLGRP